MERMPVWIDCDTGVDDAIAIVSAEALSDIEIVGLSTVAGNVPLDKTTANTLRVCDMIGKEYPVYVGADKPWVVPYINAEGVHGRDGLGNSDIPYSKREPEKEKAWDAMYEAVRKYGSKLRLVATGPLTNIANLVTLHPDITDYIKEIYIMGGAAFGGNITPCAEFNIYVDPDAAEAVFRSGLKVFMFGLDVTEKAFVKRDEVEAIGNTGGKIGAFFKHVLSEYNATSTEDPCLHDVCPIFYLTNPEMFTLREGGVFVETQSDLTRGKTVSDLESDKHFDVKNSYVAVDVDRAAFIKLLSECVASYN